MRSLMLAAARVQWQMMARDPDSLFVLAVIPFFSVTFLGVIRYADRPDLEMYALLAPMLIALWNTAVNVAGELIDADRSLGTLEAVVAAPAPFLVGLFARVLATTTFGLIGFAETLAVGHFGFGITLSIHHPGLFAVAMLLALLGTSCTAMLLAGVFVMANSARIFQRAFSYPFYVLGGVLVPVTLLPEWIQPLARFVFLSWTADLLRASVATAAPTDVLTPVAATLALCALALAAGSWLSSAAIRRARQQGTMTYA